MTFTGDDVTREYFISRLTIHRRRFNAILARSRLSSSMMMYTSSTSLSWELDRSVALFADVLLDEMLVIPGGGPFSPGSFQEVQHNRRFQPEEVRADPIEPIVVGDGHTGARVRSLGETRGHGVPGASSQKRRDL